MKTLISFIFCFSSILGYAQSIKNVDAQTFKKLIDEKNSVIIDLRTNPEIEKKGMIKNAVQIDFLSKDAEQNILNLDKNKTYLIYCAGGGRSSDCAELMQKSGFTHVINLEKGFDDWKAKGFETTKK